MAYIFVTPQPAPFTATCFSSNWSQWLRNSGPPSVLDYLPQKNIPIFHISLNQACLECPNLYLSREPVFGRIGHSGFEIEVPQVCSTIRPRKKSRYFRFFLDQAYLECPNLYLSPEPVFGRIGHNGFEIQALQVCSTVCPRKKSPYVTFL